MNLFEEKIVRNDKKKYKICMACKIKKKKF